MSPRSIYQQLLGPDFERLGPNLRRVHGSQSLVHARGTVAVVHGKGMLVRFSNWVMKVPPAAEEVALRLEIQRTPEQETWIRDFGGQKLITRQWVEKDLLIEAVGVVEMALRLRVSEGILRFEPVFTKIIGIKIPQAIGITVHAQVEEQAKGWTILVETRSALLGLLFRYRGLITLDQ